MTEFFTITAFESRASSRNYPAVFPQISHKLRTIPQKSPEIRVFQGRCGTKRDTMPFARNQFESNLTRVRIPLSPPKFVGSFKNYQPFLCLFGTFDGDFLKLLRRFFCCRVRCFSSSSRTKGSSVSVRYEDSFFSRFFWTSPSSVEWTEWRMVSVFSVKSITDHLTPNTSLRRRP